MTVNVSCTGPSLAEDVSHSARSFLSPRSTAPSTLESRIVDEYLTLVHNICMSALCFEGTAEQRDTANDPGRPPNRPHHE